jgi:hypothetical protein
MELIKVLNLPADLSDQLHSFVQAKYLELWNQSRIRYVTLWRNKWLTAKSKSIQDMVTSLREAAHLLVAMQKDGVTLDLEGGTADDYAYLVTTDPEVAKKYDMHEESEYWGEDGVEEGHPEVQDEDESP